MRNAASALELADASLAHMLNGEHDATTDYFRERQLLSDSRVDTLDTLAGTSTALDKLLHDWDDAAAADTVAGRQLVVDRQDSDATTRIVDSAVAALAQIDMQAGQYEDRIRLGTLAILVLQVLSGTLAMSGMFFAFRSSAREADGRAAALRSADTSRGQVARLFEMADVLQSATDYTDANQVLKATASDLLPGFSGALYVFNNSRDRLVLSTSWGRLDDELPVETIPPDQCWALKRGKPHLNRHDGKKLCCEHHHGDDTALEIPMIARGEIMGPVPALRHRRQRRGQARRRHQPRDGARRRHVALALANMALREKLKNQALRDPLTGLYNRRYMEDCLQRFVRLADRENREVSVVMVDLDHFKRLNDEHGHAFGDTVLRDTAVTLIGGLRETDIVCRYGGEELVVILPDCSLERAADKAEALRVRIAALTETHGTPISASFGVAAIPYTSSSVTELLASADAALYKAKQQGRDRVITAPTRPFQMQRLEDGLPARVELQAAE